MKTKEAKLILAIFFVTVLIYSISETEAVIDETGKIERTGYDGETSTVILTADIESVGSKNIEIDIKNRQYTKQQCDEMYIECRPELIDIVLNGNDDFNNISGDLNLISGIEGYPFEFSWYVDNKSIVDENGKLIAHGRGETTIYLTVSYEEWKREEVFNVQADAINSQDTEYIMNDLVEAIHKTEEEDRTGESIILPKEINGLKVSYSDKKSGRNPAIFLFPIVASVAIIWGAEKDKNKQKEDRKERILSEFAVVVQKMVMYLSAGMSLRNAWVRIYEDSIFQKKENPIYQEMGITINELKNGVSETDAYIGFSNRIGIPAITRFTTLISQNLKKGSTNLSDLLSVEAKEAFEERKRRARVKGEQAGTKMLLPMMLLMIIVMVIIMMPAFWSM